MSFELGVTKVRKKRRWGKVIEYTSQESLVPLNDKEREELVKQVKEIALKSKYITPEQLAKRTRMRVSTIKVILRELEEQNIIKLAVSGGGFKAYVPVEN